MLVGLYDCLFLDSSACMHVMMFSMYACMQRTALDVGLEDMSLLFETHKSIFVLLHRCRSAAMTTSAYLFDSNRRQ